MIIDSFESKEKILINFLEIAGLEGWNDHTLVLAFNKANIDEKFIPIIFENGLFGLLEFHIEYFNSKAQERIATIVDFKEKKIREKISTLILMRFEVEKNHRLALQRLLNFYIDLKIIAKNRSLAKPYALASLSVYKIADMMWKFIDDKSTDINFYSKRIILSKILIRCFFTFIKDNDELTATKNLIDQQIEKVINFAKIKENFKNNSQNFKNKFDEFITDENGFLKSPKQVIKSLPFFRLFKF